jgi:ribosomal protein S18 acetylase RimI-like enzyme
MTAPPPSEPPLRLRRGTAADAAAIRDLTRRAYAPWIPLIGREPLPMGVDYDQALRQHRFDLLYDGETLVALIETAVRDDHLYVANVAVSPDAQSRGLGRRLLAHAEALAAAQGLTQLRLLANAAFERNIAIYRAFGHAIDRTEPFASGGSAVYMSKTLPSVASAGRADDGDRR